MRRDTFSYYQASKIGIAVSEGGDLVDPDGNLVKITIVRDADVQKLVDEAQAVRDDVGLYSYVLSTSLITSVKGDYTATWSYTVGGSQRKFIYPFAIVDPQPFFDALGDAERQVVDNVYHKVSDGFDSSKGGPYLWELPQAKFGFETVARLATVDAMNLINYTGPKAFVPPFTFGPNTSNPLPVGWYGLVEKCTLYELMKHLARAYLEVPLPEGMNVVWMNRRDYHDRWMRMAEYERREIDSMIHMLKRDMRFGVKSRSMLLAGGIFPVSYLNPARPRWPYVLTRFY